MAVCCIFNGINFLLWVCMSVWIYVECYFPLYGWLWIIIILPFMSGLDFYSAPPHSPVNCIFNSCIEKGISAGLICLNGEPGGTSSSLQSLMLQEPCPLLNLVTLVELLQL